MGGVSSRRVGYRVRIEPGSGTIAGGEVAGLEGQNRTWVRYDSRGGASWVTGSE